MLHNWLLKIIENVINVSALYLLDFVGFLYADSKVSTVHRKLVIIFFDHRMYLLNKSLAWIHPLQFLCILL